VEWWPLLDEVPELVRHEIKTYWCDMRLTFTGVTLVEKLLLLASRHRMQLLRMPLVLVAMLVVDEAEIAVVAGSVVATSRFRVVEDLENFVI
jgi:hypothetical protein